MRILKIALYPISFLTLVLGYLYLTAEPVLKPLPQPRTSFYEVMPEGSGENPRLHHLEDGQDKVIDLSFTNGETGTLVFAKSGKLSQALYYFTDGSLRKSMRFKPDGETIVEGMELSRNDRTLLWKTESINRDSLSVTSVYWPGGQQPFSVIELNHDKGFKTTKVFRQNGAEWLDRLEDHDLLISEKYFDEAGLLRGRFSLDKASGESQQDGLRADGTLEFRQLFESFAYTKLGRHGEDVEGTALFLRKVLLVAENGDTIMRILTLTRGADGFVHEELKANEDGTRSRYKLDKEGKVVNIRRLDEQNRIIDGADNTTEKGETHTFDARYTEKPGSVWRAAVAQWSKSFPVAPSVP